MIFCVLELNISEHFCLPIKEEITRSRLVNTGQRHRPLSVVYFALLCSPRILLITAADSMVAIPLRMVQIPAEPLTNLSDALLLEHDHAVIHSGFPLVLLFACPFIIRLIGASVVD